MALRVLLADESTTIKRAIQMALSEYAVDVKGVPSGLDVLAVAHTFQPDVVFADVLLTKKNGYEVCNELKTDPKTKSIPVILMWSSFMQIDHNQVKKVRADGILEKPFDTETLRALIEKFVQKTQSFPLRGLLNHPPLPDFTESETYVRQRQSQNQRSDFNDDNSNAPIHKSMMDGIDDVEEDFSFQAPVKPTKPPKVAPPSEISDDEWSASSAGQFVIRTESFGDFEEVTVVNSKNISQSSPDLQKRIQAQVSSYLQDSPLQPLVQSKKLASEPASSPKPGSRFDEQVLREEIRQMAEKICWQIVPEITEKIVRDELNKLLQGLEKNT